MFVACSLIGDPRDRYLCFAYLSFFFLALHRVLQPYALVSSTSSLSILSLRFPEFTFLGCFYAFS